MRRLTLAIALAVALLLLLIVGAVSGSAQLLAPVLCAWTPTMVLLGYQLRAARARLRSPIAFAAAVDDEDSFT